jgi:hypothetical protein
VLSGLFIKHLLQKRKGGEMPWCFTRAREVGYKGVPKESEGWE